jgi:hypothetical protein
MQIAEIFFLVNRYLADIFAAVSAVPFSLVGSAIRGLGAIGAGFGHQVNHPPAVIDVYNYIGSPGP